MNTVGIRNSKLLVRSEHFGEYPKHYPAACWYVAIKLLDADEKGFRWCANVYIKQENALSAFDAVMATGEAVAAVSGYWLGAETCEFYPSFSGNVDIMGERWAVLCGDLVKMAEAVETAGRRAASTICTK